jgi:hypothetical protein
MTKKKLQQHGWTKKRLVGGQKKKGWWVDKKKKVGGWTKKGWLVDKKKVAKKKG